MFFAALFVLLEGLEQLGLVDWVGNRILPSSCYLYISPSFLFENKDIATWIESVPRSHRLPTAIIVILWVSAIVSAIIDSIPYTTAMVSLPLSSSSFFPPPPSTSFL